MLATMAAFPLDSIKARLQVNKYASISDCVKKTYREEGPKGFYRGIAIPMLTITIVRTLSFTIYNETKESLHYRHILAGQSIHDLALSGLLGGMMSGLSISVGSCAFELVKIRAQLESAIAAKQGRPPRDINTWTGAKEIIGLHGLRGLYFGFNLHCLRDTLGTGLYFFGYDSTRAFAELKISQIENRRLLSGMETGRLDSVRPILPFLCGSTCGVMSWFLIYPLDLIKSRLQRDALASSVIKNQVDSSPLFVARSGVMPRSTNQSFGFKAAHRVFQELMRDSNGKIRVLYSGLSISAFRSFFQHGLMWTILEKVRDQIQLRFSPT